MLANFSTPFAGGSKQSLAGDFRSRQFALAQISIAPRVMPTLARMAPQVPGGTLESSENALGTLAPREPQLPSASEQTNEQGNEINNNSLLSREELLIFEALLIGLLRSTGQFWFPQRQSSLGVFRRFQSTPRHLRSHPSQYWHHARSDREYVTTQIVAKGNYPPSSASNRQQTK